MKIQIYAVQNVRNLFLRLEKGKIHTMTLNTFIEFRTISSFVDDGIVRLISPYKYKDHPFLGGCVERYYESLETRTE